MASGLSPRIQATRDSPWAGTCPESPSPRRSLSPSPLEARTVAGLGNDPMSSGIDAPLPPKTFFRQVLMTLPHGSTCVFTSKRLISPVMSGLTGVTICTMRVGTRHSPSPLIHPIILMTALNLSSAHRIALTLWTSRAANKTGRKTPTVFGITRSLESGAMSGWKSFPKVTLSR